MESIWKESVRLSSTDALTEDIRVKNVVIGAGITGILTAYLLQEKGQEVIVLEQDTIASGQTKNTTAKITSQHGYIYYDMQEKLGEARAKGYALANEAAIREYKKIITKEGIACHFESLPSFLYTKEKEKCGRLRKEAQTANALGITAEYVEGEKITELPFAVEGAVRFDNQAQFHPLEFVQAIVPKLTIYEHTKVLEVDDYIIITNRGVIVAENIIFATHYPFFYKPGYFFLRQHQSRSYVLAIEGKGIPTQLEGMYYGIDEDSVSLRSAMGYLLVGGGAHRTGEIAKGGFCALRKLTKQYYNDYKECWCWAAQDCMPQDEIPFIGQVAKSREHWYVATGFQKWGMSTAMIAAMIISDKVIGKENRYAWVFAPQRILLSVSFKNFVKDAWISACGLTKGLFVKKDRRCTHMGCALKWNGEEGSFDCACHGSRFDEKGKRIDNPAQIDLGSK